MNSSDEINLKFLLNKMIVNFNVLDAHMEDKIRCNVDGSLIVTLKF